MLILASIAATILLCALGVWADYYLKIAGSGEQFIVFRSFLIGFALHGTAVVGWFFVLKYIKLVQLGVFYSVSMILLLAALGVWQFNEQLGPREFLGISLAVASLLLMAKFV